MDIMMNSYDCYNKWKLDISVFSYNMQAGCQVSLSLFKICVAENMEEECSGSVTRNVNGYLSLRVMKDRRAKYRRGQTH